MDMSVDLFAEFDFGQLALKKLGHVHENFRLYSCEWLGDDKNPFQTMKVTGAEFRHAQAGKNKGHLSIIVPGTKRTVFVTSEEISIQEKEKP